MMIMEVPFYMGMGKSSSDDKHYESPSDSLSDYLL